MFTREQMKLLSDKIENTRSTLENKIIPETLQENNKVLNKAIEEIVAQTVKETILAIKNDPSILGK